MRVSLAGDEARAKSEIRQLETNINGYKAALHVDHLPAFGHQDSNPANWAIVNPNRYFRLLRKYDGTIPPSSLSGQNAPTDTSCFEWQYLSRIFPGLSPSNTGLAKDYLFDSNQTMVFFLTGGEVTQYSGFSNDPSRPFDYSPATQNNRKGKYFDIPDNRLQVINGVRTGRYLDPWGTPYLYMAPYDGKQYPMPATATTDVILQAVLLNMGVAGQPTGVNPYRSLVTTTPTQIITKGVNDGSFQIISAGPNKIFGRGGFYVPGPPTGLNPYTPGVSPYTDKDPGGDDFANFRNLKLSATSD
jgi:hypothetical protein